MLLVRGAHLDDETQLALQHRFGQVLAPGGRELMTVSLDPTKNPTAEYLKDTFHWHIDGTNDAVPAKATFLTARHVAMVGGGTEFASTYAAYESVPEHDRKMYEDLRVVHAQRLVRQDHTEKELAGLRRVPTLESPTPTNGRSATS